ncbi:MAG: cation-translocating P-type ATPase [Bdellovibrionales bacterium]
MKWISLEALRGLERHEGGLRETQVSAQRGRFGPNDIVETAGNPLLELVIDTLKDPMIWFLVGIGCIFLMTGEVTDAITLFVAVLPLLLMDAFLHWRTQASTASLKGQLSSHAKVLRDGKEYEIDSRGLVPGDLLIVEPGVLLPADGIFESSQDIQIDESALTGEAFPITKKQSEIDLFANSFQQEVFVDAQSLAFAGTRVLTGHGTLRVTSTGTSTAYGEIVRSVAQMPHERTPLQKSITRLVTMLIYAAGILCLLLASIRIYQGHGWLDALLSAATLAVAAIPEEFPVVFTFFLGVGIYRLAKKRALVRRAVSVENIGRVTQICTDKTGTITLGQLKLMHLDPMASLSDSDLIQIAMVASSSSSDPMDLAVRDFARVKKVKPSKILRTFPFTEDRKRETGFYLSETGSPVACVKGSPETILAASALSTQERAQWMEKISSWAKEGHKVVACATKHLALEANLDEPTANLEFCGLLAFEDPVRPQVAKSVEYCLGSGIRVLMITGDHPETATAIAREAGLIAGPPRIISAEENPAFFEERWLEQNPDFLKNQQVISRCTPMQKLRIVTALQKAGEIVAVTGDGVNDVPALKAADIGIAMGERGTRSAREVSSIILADDNFSTIVNAIREGRQLFKNLRMSFEYLMLIHIPLVLSAAAVPLLGYPLVFLPVHIVWLELVIHPTALLAFQASATSENKELQSRPSFFTRREAFTIVAVGVAMTAVLVYLFLNQLNSDGIVEKARSKGMALLILWSGGIALHLTQFRNKVANLTVGLTVLTSIFLIQISSALPFFHVSPLSLNSWFEISSAILLVIFAIFVNTQ